METLVLRKVIKLGKLRLRLVEVGPGVISQGVMKLEQVKVICPACGQQIEAVANDGRVKGYCAVAKQYVDFPIETQLERKRFYQDPEYRARHSAGMKKRWQDPEYRARHSAGMKKRWQDPGYRARQIAIQTGKNLTAETRAKMSSVLNTAESRAKRSTAMKRWWQDPEYRGKQIATHTGKHPTAKTKAKISAAVKKRFNAERGASERTG